MHASVSPRLSPSFARPPAIVRTLSAYSRQVSETSSPRVRIATSSGRFAAVIWNASQTVRAWSESAPAPLGCVWVVVIPGTLSRAPGSRNRGAA
jgi:hypothetical protein